MIAGLGNPGPRYRGTRHNVGFDVVDLLAKRAAVTFESAPAAALMGRVRSVSADDVLLVKPMTFVNDSGSAIGELMRYFKVGVDDTLIVFDEAQLPLGKLRARASGSAGGHNGMKSVIAHLGSNIARLRVGIGRGDAQRDLADHVLARFDEDEAAEVERMIARAADAAETFTTAGIAAVMNEFNGGDPSTTE